MKEHTSLLLFYFIFVNGILAQTTSPTTLIKPNITTLELPLNSTETKDSLLSGNDIRPGKGKIIKVGHIGAINVMPKAEQILEMCRKELWRDGILDDEFDIELVQTKACSDSFEGVALAANMFHVQNVKAFIGPYCNAEMDAVSKMSSYWNVPIIGYMAASNIFSDKNIYKTLARVSIRTTNSLALAVAATIKHYNWRDVLIITNTGVTALERLVAFEENFHLADINIMRKITFDENANAKSLVDAGIMQDIKNYGRIVVCIFSNTRETSKEFMAAVKLANMDFSFVYIFPWLISEAKERAPWIEENGTLNTTIKRMFSSSIIVDDVNSFDEIMINPFKDKLLANHIDVAELDLNNVYGYIHLYDALKLYALIAKQLLNETKNDLTSANNGKLVWNKMRKFSFPGLVSTEGVSAGMVVLDDRAERAAQYGAFYANHEKEDVLKILDMDPVFKSQCDGLKTKTGCYDLKVTDVVTGFWPSIDSRIPKDQPDCGYRNEKCDYTLIIIICVLATLIIIAAITIFICLRILENKRLEKTTWRVWRDDARVVTEDEVKSMLSIGSSKTKMSNMSKFVKHHALIGTGTHVSFQVYHQKKHPITFKKDDMRSFDNMKLLVHDNINPFIGMSFNEKNEVVLYWKFCSRGTIQDIIYNEDVALDASFHSAFVRDVTCGLEYLHLSQIGFHGSLSSYSCLIDRNWTVKLTDYGIADYIDKWCKEGFIEEECIKEGENKAAAKQKTYVLYASPESLKQTESNNRRRVDQNWMKTTIARKQSQDVYSLGIIIYEILFRALPFPDSKNLDELCIESKSGNSVTRPTINDKSQIHPDLCALLYDCWNINPEVRPSIRRVKLNTEHYLKVKGSLVDQMMRVMEQYANNLEKLVQERTGMLEEANKSDFSKICAATTPFNVVALLNDLYNGFDGVIAKFDVYRVEIISSCQLIVSGIPQENGKNHLANLCDVALSMMEFVRSYKIPHKKELKLTICIGLHTGPVAAAVVGLSAPRYCLFGDTVNMASRMESTGLSEAIQISEAYNQKLATHFPEFRTTQRGLVSVKGKGEVMTYFLISKDETFNLF